MHSYVVGRSNRLHHRNEASHGSYCFYYSLWFEWTQWTSETGLNHGPSGVAVWAKGQLILKCLFGVFTFFQKRTKTSRQVVKSNLFVRFLEETSAWKNHFEFVWPLAVHPWRAGPDCGKFIYLFNWSAKNWGVQYFHFTSFVNAPFYCSGRLTSSTPVFCHH